MAFPVSPSAAFPAIASSPMGMSSQVAAAPLMSGTMNWEPVRQRLLGPNLDDALAAATELREGIEIVHTVEFPLMLSALLPAFSTILAHRTNPNADKSTVEHKLRNVVLEIISRMPSNEILRPHAPHLVAVALDILNRDYEENALLASRIIFDLYKVYRTLPQDYVQPYLDFVLNSYRALPASVQRNFSFNALVVAPAGETPSGTTSSSSDLKSSDPPSTAQEQSEPSVDSNQNPGPLPSTPASTGNMPAATTTPPGPSMSSSPSFSRIPSTPTPQLSPTSNSSFRVLTEFPLTVMLMFQLYPKFLRNNIPSLITVMMEGLALRAPSLQVVTQGTQSLDDNAKRLYFSRCQELVAAQAKTLSFLTYLLRGFSNDLKPHEDRLATNVVALMSTCPREFISTRKELLVATRHLLNSDFRNGFFRHVDSLLDERVLMGSHHRYAEQTVLRPLGYTTLSDLVHHVKAKLTLNQISKVVSIFSRVLHDTSMVLPMSTQYTAVRTLLSVVDIVFNNKDRNPQIGRDILVRILKTLGDKLDALHSCRIQVEKLKSRNGVLHESTTAGLSDLAILAQLESPVGSDAKESLRDLKSMVRAIIVGHKTLIWYINKYRGQREKDKIEAPPLPPGANEEISSAMLKITHTEQALIDRYIRLAFPCMKWLKDEPANDTHGAQQGTKPAADHFRDALSYFAAAFTVLDGYDLCRTLGRRLEELIDAVTDDPAAILVPRHLLAANATTSFEFCTLLLNFLVERMDMLATSVHVGIQFVPPADGGDVNEAERLQALMDATNTMESKEDLIKRSAAHLQLFERVLKSLSSFPENERALRPHLRKIVSKCLQASMEKEDFKVDNHCMLLRYIFRSISAGKFEESYRELLPLIPTVLNGLFRIFRATDDPFLHHTIIELLLTIPARLSSLLPHMNILLRVIISALESQSGDLVNLGLRTLEFWVDNLNPEFLFPEISKQSELFVSLMKALSTHLRPAPYPYGLLTLRLLGKLGGKNRRVLREPMDIKDPASFKALSRSLRLPFSWLNESESMETEPPEESVMNQAETKSNHSLPLSIESCVELIKRILLLPEVDHDVEQGNKISDSAILWKDSEKLWDIRIEETDFMPYCLDVMHSTQKEQVESALAILRVALNEMIVVEEFDLETVDVLGLCASQDQAPHEAGQGGAISDSFSPLRVSDKDFEHVSFGLMLSCAIASVSEASIRFAKGFLTHTFVVVLSHQRCFVRIDANGSRIGSEHDEGGGIGASDFFEDGLGSLKPFGYFEQAGCLQGCTNPLIVNKSLAELLAQSSPRAREIGMELLQHLLDLAESLNPNLSDGANHRNPDEMNRGALVFFESLLSALCEKCIVTRWNRRDGLHSGICLLLQKKGKLWSRKYEIEVMNAALFALKSVPREMAMASVKAFEFLIQVCVAMYGPAKVLVEGGFVFDALASKPELQETTDSEIENPTSSSTAPTDKHRDEEEEKGSSLFHPSEEVLQILITEMSSTKNILRIASRYIIKHYVMEVIAHEKCLDLFNNHIALIKRVLFSRSLRLLPLPEQVGVVEALAMLVDQLPTLIPLNDQHLLAFLSELLKMSSVADGEMTDPNLSGNIVDKDGFVVPVHEQSVTGKPDTRMPSGEKPSSALFLRRDCILSTVGAKVFIPQECATGVQLRSASILLLRAVIRGHSNPFFDAEGSTPIGNIRPHVISLLFRSLASAPIQCVNAAHDALRDVLTLSVVSDGGKSKSRLRKELLQTCIRPVLLNLRDYTRLSVYLLRGLSRLLSLLSSWFNKTLGEKLLDHLQKWTDPGRMKSQKIWHEGEEPDVAAAIIDLFVLLPHASHFVEPLVKTTIKLEACLPVFQPRYTLSPYRKPLARYLNKHSQNTIAFFLQRLKTPLYSEIFQDVIALPESCSLREFLARRESSVSLLNVCFERPLGIIRSEKAASATASPGGYPTNPSSQQNMKELFILHGIHPFTASPTQKEINLKQDVESKKKKLQILQQELNRAKESLHGKTSHAGSNLTPAEVEEAKKKIKMSKAALDRGTKDLNESRQKYAAEMAQINASQSPQVQDNQTRPMTVEALELQHQGFCLVKTLIANDRGYFGEHNDVLRAFRWLWRSKGRYLRLQHEDSVPPRYHDESKLLATILVDYSESSPSDVDLLFELIRIFLQPGSCDFSFVRYSLSTAVANLFLEQKKQILQRFFALLSGESSEEIKTLSLQLVVYPMLQTFFKEEQTRPNTLPTDREKGLPELTNIIEASTAKRFVSEVLFNHDRPIHCGDRLKVELMKMANILIEFVPDQMEAFGKEIVRFCLSFLKSDDASCKSWAYLVLCRYISATQSATHLILQVYSALIRSHQPEGKEIIREALDLLIPAMEGRLTESEKKKATEFTNRIMFEEVNSVPQLAHTWSIVVSHSARYYGNRHHFVRHMINSLTRLGLPPNAPPENRSLSVSVVELVLLWHRRQEDETENERKSEVGELKRKINQTEPGDVADGHIEKKSKASMSVIGIPEKSLPERAPLLDQTMVDTLVNFAVRLKILLADPKLDIGISDISQRIDPLLTSIMTDWPQCHIQQVYLEKVVSMCREYNLEVDSLSSEKRQGRKLIGKSKAPSKSKSSSSNQSTTGTKSDDSRPLTSSLLSACLDIFATLSRCAPKNIFLTENASQLNEILTSSFYFSRKHEETELRVKLKMLVVYVLSLEQGTSRMDVRVVRRLNVLVERFLSDSEKEYGKKQSENSSPDDSIHHGNLGSRSPSGEDDINDDDAVYFAVQIVKEVNAAKTSYFKSYASVLIALLSTIVKRHTTAASTKQKHGGVSFVPQTGTSTIRQMYHTPTSGILAECSTETSSPGSSGIRTLQAKDSFPSKILNEFDQGLGAAVMILEIIGGSDVAYSFTALRKTLFQTLSLILDSSNNVQLLMTAVRLVGRWLSESSNGPLTLKERNNFLWKIASFDFNGMPDVVSQPLADLVAQFVILLLQGNANRRMEDPNLKLSIATQRFGDSDEMLIGRSLVACLLTANNSLRESLLSHFVSRVSVGTGNTSSSISEPERIPRRTPAALMWQLFHSDFEGLGGRNWIVLFVEILLSSSCFLPSTRTRHGRLPSPLARAASKNPLTLNNSDFAVFSDTMKAANKDLASGAYLFRISLSRLAHGDHALAHALFEILFPGAWASISSDAVRCKLAAPIESLLSRSYHSQFLKYGAMSDLSYPTNAIRSFLNGLGSLSPMPILDVDLLVSLAESYTCWYEVLSILEDQFVVLSCKNLSKSGESLRDKVLLAMRHCYKELGESNIALTLSLIPCQLSQSHRAASLAVHGEIDKALEEYTSLVEFVESSQDLALSVFEEKLIEERWINLNRELCQTTVISEYAKTASVPHLMLESAWKQREWDQVRGLCSSPALVAAVESGEVAVKMCETLLAVADGKLSDVENLHAQTAQLCLYKWQLLPSLSHASLAHASLLHLFHRLVEIRESGQIMVETGNHSTGKTLPDLKNLLKHRLPNDYEELVIWDEIFTWRSHMFSAITSNFSWSEPSTLATLHDRPWTTIRMAMAARKQGMKQTSLLILNKITDNRAMDVSDAFFKLREQVMAYNNADNELERTGGLNLINTTNLSFFDASQKSELFRLKAMFLSSLRRTSKSNQAYCHSVQICPSHAKAWTSWGGLCSSLGTLTEKQAEQIAVKGGNAPDNIKESKAAAAKKVAQYLAQAMGCYIEAVQIEATEKNRIHLPKCLWLLTKDGHTPGVLCQTLESRGTKVPPWVWLPWIPQLLTGLCRNEGQAIKSLLSRVVKAYPQAVYYSLRAFYLERRDVERAKGVSATSSSHMPSVAYAEEMMSTLRRSHASLWSALEAILEELIVKFRPSYEEELLATISALLERAEAHLEKQSLPDKARMEDEEAMVASWSKTLSRIASKFFRSMDDSAVASSRRDERVKKTTEFKRKYKDEFEADFQVNGTEGPESPTLSESKPQFKLTEYITRLQKWKAKLESQVACTPASLPLIESSHALAMYAGESPDLWPGACDTKYLSAACDTNQEDDEDQSRHQSTTSSAAIARKAAFNAAMVAAKAAAREGVGGEYGGGSAAIEIPGQYCPNSSTTADIKPCPELHVKLQRFEPVVEVLKRNDQLIRRVSMVGSDGRVYRFLLQFAIPYWTRTDERTSQTNFIIDKFLRQNVVTARNHLSVQPSAAIPVAQRLRMTLDVDSRVALDDVFRFADSVIDSSEQQLASLPTYFLRQVDEKLASSTTPETNQEEKEKLEKQIRCQVYNDIVQTKVDPKVFLRFVQRQLDGPENLFHFRRALAGQLASNSLLQYIFSVAERTPPRLVVVLSKALVMSPDFRVSYSNQGFIEGHDIPFRMTPNIEALIGRTYLDGRFIRSIAMVAGAIREHREEFDPILRLLMRDDILAWYSKSLAKTDSKTQELERQLMERVSKNVSVLHARFSECAPTSTKASKEGSIDSRIRELYDAATSAENLSMMPTNYHAWL